MNLNFFTDNKKVFYLIIILLIIVFGAIGYVNLSFDLLSDVVSPIVTVSTAYPNASAEEIENIITKPLENAFQSINGIESVSSTTRQGVSSVTVDFKTEVKINLIKKTLEDKIKFVESLFPLNVRKPNVRLFRTDDIPFLVISVSRNKEKTELLDIFEKYIRPRLILIKNVRDINTFDAGQKIIQVTPDEFLMSSNGIKFQQITTVLNDKNINCYVHEDYSKRKIIFLIINGDSKDSIDYGNIPISGSDNKIVYIKDIASIEQKFWYGRSITRVNRENGILFAVYPNKGINLLKASKLVKKEIQNIKNKLPENVSINIVNDTTTSISNNIQVFLKYLILTIFIMTVITWLCLGNFRMTSIIIFSVLISMLGTFFLMDISGISFNVITMLALNIFIILLFNNSLSAGENIFRHIEHGKSRISAVENGANEVSITMLFIFFLMLVLFVPILFLNGMIGELFKTFGLVVLFLSAFSLIYGLTAIPLFSEYLLKHIADKKKKNNQIFFKNLMIKRNKVIAAIDDFYKKILQWGLKHKYTMNFSIIGIFLFAVLISSSIKSNFMNYTDNGNFIITLEAMPGLPLQVIDDYAKNIEDFLAKQKDIEFFLLNYQA